MAAMGDGVVGVGRGGFGGGLVRGEGSLVVWAAVSGGVGLGRGWSGGVGGGVPHTYS